MSQSKVRSYINIASFKLNRISLLNQSQFNPLLYSIYKINNKMNLLQQERNKINPLTRKNKIIKKHNILKKIDFNINSNQAYQQKNNNIYTNKSILLNNRSRLIKSPYEHRATNNIHLPILAYNNNLMILNSNKNNDNSFRKLYQNNNMKNSNSFTFNSILSKNHFPNSSKNNNLPNLNDITRNDTIKSFRPNFTNKEIQTSEELISLEYQHNNKNENNKSRNKAYKIVIKSKFNHNEKNDEDSSDDFDYKKEIEKIITTKSKSNIKNLKGINDYYTNNNSKTRNKNDTNYISLRSLYKIKSFKNDKSDIFHQIEQEVKLIPLRNKKIDKNFINKINFIQRNNLNLRHHKLTKINKQERKSLPKYAIYKLLNKSYETKNQNSISNGNGNN